MLNPIDTKIKLLLLLLLLLLLVCHGFSKLEVTLGKLSAPETSYSVLLTSILWPHLAVHV